MCFFKRPSSIQTVFTIHTNNALTLYKTVKDYQTVMDFQYRYTTIKDSIRIISQKYINILNKNIDKLYNDITKTFGDNVKVIDRETKKENWKTKEEKWKLIYILTFMVTDHNSFSGVQVFDNYKTFKQKPHEFLTDHIHGLLLEYENNENNDNNLPPEAKVKEKLGISKAYAGSEYFRKVYHNFYNENIYKSVYLCMEFWDLKEYIEYNIFQILIDNTLRDNYINEKPTEEPIIPFIHYSYVEQMFEKIESVKEYAIRYGRWSFPHDTVWKDKQQKWKLIYVLTFMVNNENIKKITICTDDQNPRECLTERIYNISLNSANEEKIKEQLGIKDSKDNNSNEFNRVYSYCKTENTCILVSLCMEFWTKDLTKNIEYIDCDIFIPIFESIGPIKTNDGNANAKPSTGSSTPNANEGATTVTEMSNVIIRF